MKNLPWFSGGILWSPYDRSGQVDTDDECDPYPSETTDIQRASQKRGSLMSPNTYCGWVIGRG
jgi:hypothetical protein